MTQNQTFVVLNDKKCSPIVKSQLGLPLILILTLPVIRFGVKQLSARRKPVRLVEVVDAVRHLESSKSGNRIVTAYDCGI